MLSVLKWLAILTILALIGLAGYAYLGDMSPDQAPSKIPVILDGQS